MKRIPALQPLSREHHSALTLAKACERAAQSCDESLVVEACQRAIRELSTELEAHFQVEEQFLLPLLDSVEAQALVQRTLTEHQQLRALLDDLRLNDGDALGSFGKGLSAHVRFEERVLFPAIEKQL